MNYLATQTDTTDIPLSQAIICWDREKRQAFVLRDLGHPVSNITASYIFGACYPYWQNIDAETRLSELTLELWYAVVLYSIDPTLIDAALRIIPEYRELMPEKA